MPASVASLPRDATLILLDFLAPCVAPLVTLDRAMWGKFAGDALVWRKAAEILIQNREGRARMWPIATLLVERCPELHNILPVLVVAENAKRVALSGNGKFMAHGYDTVLEVLDLDSHQLCFAAQVDDASKLCFSEDSSVLACAMLWSGVLIIDCSTWSAIKVVASDGRDWGCIALLPSDHAVVTGALSGSLAIWDMQSGYLRKEFEKQRGVTALASSKTMFASGHDSGHVFTWSHSGQLNLSLLGGSVSRAGHLLGVVDLVFTADESLLISAGNDYRALVWNLSTGRCIHNYQNRLELVRSVAMSDSGLLAIGFSRAIEIFSRPGEEHPVRKIMVDIELAPRGNMKFSSPESTIGGDFIYLATEGGQCLRFAV